MSFRKRFGQKLKEIRTKAGLSQEKLAEKIDVSRNTISRIETGVNLPTDDNIEKLHELLILDIDHLFDNETHIRIANKLKLVDDDKLNLVENFIDTILNLQ